MKPLNQIEIEILAEQLRDELVGAQLQDLWAFNDGLVLHFYRQQDLFLVVDMKKSQPFAGLFRGESPMSRQTPKKPVVLFLAAHGKNSFVQSVEERFEFGRVFELHLGSKQNASASLSKLVTLQLHLVPHRGNVVVQLYQSKGKAIPTQSLAVEDIGHDLVLTHEIFWNKPFPLEQRESVLQEGLETRSLAELNREWREGFKPKGSSSSEKKISEAVFLQQRQKNLIKKADAVESLHEDMQLLFRPFVEWGQVLRGYQFASGAELENGPNLISKLQSYISANQIPLPQEEGFYAWLRQQQDRWFKDVIEKAFEANKNQARKLAGLQERLQGLQQEIETLQSQTYQQFLQQTSSKTKPQRQLNEVRARKLNLISGAIVHLGKSAQDNMKILRAAKPWDYWLHLRDLPGAHAVIHRDRNQNLSDEEVRKVAHWVIQESVKSKQKLDGQKFEVIMTECRFVKPIKGDKLGRVNFSNEKNLVYYFRE